MSDKIKIRADFRSILNSHISYGQVDSTSTSTVFTATVDGITELVDGTAVMLRNGYVTSASGFTLEVNGLGAKPVYNSMADATQDTTIFNINYTMLFVYDSTRITGGCWICYRGYNTNDNTIGYQIRTNNTVFTTTDKGYRYRLWLQTDEGKLMPVNTSTSTNATANRSSYMNTREFWLDGKIIYNSTKADYQADVTLPAGTMWQQYNFALGYSFNNTGKSLTLTSGEPLYMVATDEGDGKGKLASPYYTQTLPSSVDGKLYIYLGHMTSAVNMELALEHPIFEYKNNGIRLYRDTYTTSEVDTLLNGKSDTGHTHTGYANSTHNHTKSQITDFPTIPSKTSDLNNDSGFLTSHNPIDSSLSTTSTNAVQNKVINTALSGKSDTGHTHTKSEITDFPSSMTPASHTHGNLQNNGQVGSTAQSSKNVVTDANGKITTEDKPTIPSASTTTPSADTTNGSVGTGTTWARSNHTHPKSSIYAESTHSHTKSEISDFPSLHTVATSGSYNDLTNKPNIPSGVVVDTSLDSDSDHAISNSAVTTALNGKSDTGHTHNQYLTSHQDITGKLDKTQTSYKGKNVVVDSTSGEITFEDKNNHTHSNYLTSHQDISGKLDIAQTSYKGKNVVVDSTTGNITFENKPTIPSASSTTPSADTQDGSYGTGTNYARDKKKKKKSTLYAEANHNHDSSYIAKASTDTGFVKSDGSIDGNTYLTTANASSTYVAKETGKGLFTGSYSDLTNKPSYTATVTSSTTGAYKLGSINISGSSVDIYGKDTHQSLTDYIQKSSTSGLIKNDGSIMTGGTGASNFAIGNHNHSYNDLTNKPTIPSKTSDLQNDGDGTNVFLTQHQSLTNYLQQSDVKDNLTSTDTNKPLSANQGKELKTLIDGKANLSDLELNSVKLDNLLDDMINYGIYNDIEW